MESAKTFELNEKQEVDKEKGESPGKKLNWIYYKFSGLTNSVADMCFAEWNF